jgi:anti-sigma factor RsiW
MTDLHHDQLLLVAYGELRDADLERVQIHLAGCQACRNKPVRLEMSRAALDLAMPPAGGSRRRGRWIAAGLAAAAVLATVILTTTSPNRPEPQGWRPTSSWSATAGYVTGGSAMAEIDAQLTRLEQERFYGLPN